MKSSNTRQPLHQQVPEQKGPFFNHTQNDAQKKDDVFFQTKLAIGKKDDKHEQEADAVADKVQKKAEEKEKPEVQKKEEEKEKPDVQKKGKEEEQQPDKHASGAAPANADKQPNKHSAPPPGKDKMPGQAGSKDLAGGPAKGGPEEKAANGQQSAAGKEDEKKISKKEEDKEAAVQKKAQEEEKPVQKMSKDDKKDEDKTKINKQEDEAVQKKEAGAATQAAPHKVSLEERIKQSKGKGQSLPDDVKKFLETQMGADFSEVVIHTDGEAAAMNKELKARAFTNGFDVYFNEGQYMPDTAEGRKLLAHELTHVIQQTGVSKKKKNDKK